MTAVQMREETSRYERKERHLVKPLATFLAEKREITIHTLVSYLRPYIQEHWQLILQENQQELHQLFEKAGEAAYGVYGRKLLGPVFEQLPHIGFVLESEKPGLPPSNSLEYWGPPEERERCHWYVVKRADGTDVGTIVTRGFHDHTHFRIPRAHEVFALAETERCAILTALSQASVRLDSKRDGSSFSQRTPDGHTLLRWEYSLEVGLADGIDSDHPEVTEGALDASLALWGRYGWELTTVVPHQERLLAFFKRPAAVKEGKRSE
jgi:hypothetical protein